MSKPTLQEVAVHAGVSTATVDRVLHARSGVSAKAQRRVNEAVRELGFGQFEGVTAREKVNLQFDFLVPDMDTGFTADIIAAVQRTPGAMDDVVIKPVIHPVPLGDGRAVADTLDSLDPSVVNGVAIFAVDTPGVRHAIDAAVDRGLAVVTLVADVPGSRRHHYVGIDNIAAGRVAANLMGRFAAGRRGPVAMISGSRRQRDLIERELGFQQVIEERFPDLKILPVEQGGSDGDTNRRIIVELLSKHKDLVGVYSLAAGNIGLLAGLNDADADEPPLLVLHELSEVTRKGLLDGRVDAVISQNVDHMARSVVRVLRSHCLGTELVASQERIGIDVFFADNLP